MIKDALKRSSKAYLRSALEDAVQNNVGKNFKSQSVINHLKNRGVKPAEIEGAGIQRFIEDYSVDGRVSIDHLGKWIKGNRESNSDRPSDLLSSRESKKHKTVVETEIKSGGSRYEYNSKVYGKYNNFKVNNHYNNDPMYYSHVRYNDETFKGSKIRRISEIQSDKHSMGYKEVTSQKFEYEYDQHRLYFGNRFFSLFQNIGGKNPREDDYLKQLAIEFLSNTRKYTNRNLDISNIIGDYAYKLQDVPMYKHIIGKGDINSTANKIGKLFKHSVERFNDINANNNLNQFKKDPKFLRNTINKFFVDSFNEKRTVLEFRIADDGYLHRGKSDNTKKYPGFDKPMNWVQHWYETDVKNTLIKAAKDIGAKVVYPSGATGAYLRVVLPAAGFSLPLYAKDNKEFMNEAKKLYTPEEIEDFMESKATIMRTNKND